MANQKIRSRRHVRKKWRRFGRYVIGVIIGAFIIIGGLVAATHWQDIQIQSFSVSVPDNTDLPQEQMESLVGTIIRTHQWGVLGRDNIVLLPRARIRGSIESLSPEIRSADINLTGLRSFAVEVKKRQPVGRVCSSRDVEVSGDTNCRFIDKDGFIYTRADSSGTSTQIVYTTKSTSTPDIGSNLLPQQTFSVLRSFLTNLPKLGFGPQRVQLMNDRDVYITVSDNTKATTTTPSSVRIRVDLSDNLNQAYTDLKTVTEKNAFVATSSEQATGTSQQAVPPFELEYIDLRFDDKVFYK